MSASKKSFVCILENCNASFNSLHLLKCHSRIHTNERPYTCSYAGCSKGYTRRQHLTRHESTHETSYRCTEENCDKVFSNTQNLKRHVDNVHLKKNPKTYKCSYCDEQFNKHSWLKQHEYKHTGLKPYECPNEGCGKRFLLPVKLRRHLKVHEGYTCSQSNCNETFSKWTLYLKHLKVAHPIIFKCSICERRFSTLSNLKAHSYMHLNPENKEVFECTYPNCSQFYYAQRNLNYHVKSYHEKRPFVCDVENCYKSFKTEVEMTRHNKYKHDPNKRLGKRKKKKKKPSFAALLSGSAQRIKQKTHEGKVKDRVAVSEKLSHEPCQNSSLEKAQDENSIANDKDKTSEDEIEVLVNKDSKNNKCVGILVHENEDKEKNEESSLTHNVHSEIQALLNMINERNAFDTQSAIPKSQYVSFKEFIKCD